MPPRLPPRHSRSPRTAGRGATHANRRREMRLVAWARQTHRTNQLPCLAQLDRPVAGPSCENCARCRSIQAFDASSVGNGVRYCMTTPSADSAANGARSLSSQERRVSLLECSGKVTGPKTPTTGDAPSHRLLELQHEIVDRRRIAEHNTVRASSGWRRNWPSATNLNPTASTSARSVCSAIR